MKRFALVFAAFAALPLAACGGSEAPAVQEARVEEARLKDFVAFFPKPLTGWKAGQPGPRPPTTNPPFRSAR